MKGFYGCAVTLNPIFVSNLFKNILTCLIHKFHLFICFRLSYTNFSSKTNVNKSG